MRKKKQPSLSSLSQFCVVLEYSYFIAYFLRLANIGGPSLFPESINGPKKTTHKYFGHPVTFPITPSEGSNFWF